MVNWGQRFAFEFVFEFEIEFTKFFNMKNIFSGIILTLTLALLCWSCEKDEVRAILTPGTTPALTANETTLVLQSSQATDSLSLLSWTASDFGFDESVKYTVQLANAGTDFVTGSTLKSVVAGNVLSFKYTVAALNTTAKNTAGITAGVEGPIEVRIKAEVNSVTAVTGVDPVYSNTVVLNVTPY